MTIRLNGKAHEIENALSIAALLESLGLGGKPVVVELDEQAVFPRDYPNVTLGEGSNVEIVTLAAGG